MPRDDYNHPARRFIVDPVITYTLEIGAVRKPQLPGEIESVYLFLEFTISTLSGKLSCS